MFIGFIFSDRAHWLIDWIFHFHFHFHHRRDSIEYKRSLGTSELVAHFGHDVEEYRCFFTLGRGRGLVLVAQILEVPFSAVSKPILQRNAHVAAFFKDLQDLHTFAPLRTRSFQFFAPSWKSSLNNCPGIFSFFLRVCKIVLQFYQNTKYVLLVYYLLNFAGRAGNPR